MKKRLKTLKEARAVAINGKLAIMDKGIEEKRGLKDDEQTKSDTFQSEIDDLDAQIEVLEEKVKLELRAAAENPLPADMGTQEDPVKKEIKKRFSIVKAIAEQRTGSLSGFEKEMHEEGIKEARLNNQSVDGLSLGTSVIVAMAEKRTMNTGTNSAGGYIVPTETGSIIDALSPRLEVARLGATMLGGLVGNLTLPRNSTTPTGTWEGEIDAAAEKQPTMEQVAFSPKRCAGFIDVSGQLLRQRSPSIDAWLENILLQGIANTWDAAAINGSGSGEPMGILNASGIGSIAISANGGALTHSLILQLEEIVANVNGDKGALAYLTNAKVRRFLKNLAVESGDARRVWDKVEKLTPLNGYGVGISTNVPSDLSKGSGSNLSSIIFGNFNDVAMAQWGGIDLLSDPYTGAKSGKISLVANSYLDVQVMQPKSFAVIKDATT